MDLDAHGTEAELHGQSSRFTPIVHVYLNNMPITNVTKIAPFDSFYIKTMDLDAHGTDAKL